MLTALDVAGYLIRLAAENDENDLTNLKLQKVLYFAQGEYLCSTGIGLFEDDIEAWSYGPVVRSVYNAFKSCGAFPISFFDVKVSINELPSEIKDFLRGIWEKYGKYSAFYLVSMTHMPGTPWTNHCQSDDTKIITIDELKVHFCQTEVT